MAWWDDILETGIPDSIDNIEGVINMVGDLINPPDTPASLVEQQPEQIITAAQAGPLPISEAPAPALDTALKPDKAFNLGLNGKNMMPLFLLGAVAFGAFILLKK